VKISNHTLVSGTADLHTATWFKSTRSGNYGACVEVARLVVGTAVRDSKRPHGPTLLFSSGQWRSFVGSTKVGRFDLNLA
jgi:hypothetical protein